MMRREGLAAEKQGKQKSANIEKASLSSAPPSSELRKRYYFDLYKGPSKCNHQKKREHRV